MCQYLVRWICQPALAAVVWLSASAAATAGSPTCTVSMSSIAFGSVDVLAGSAIDTTATLTVSCSGGSGAGQRLCISIGAGSASDATSRKLTGPGSNAARYDLYKDTARTQLWGSWQTGYDIAGVQLDVPQSSTRNVTVYARFLGSQQTIVAGSYVATFSADPFIQYDNLGSVACPVGARTASTSTSATATVVSRCNVSASNINFGTLGSLISNTDAAGTMAIQCNSTLPYTVSLDGGTSGAVNPTQRKMALGSNNVIYGLYRDSARTLPWGAVVGTDTAAGTGNGLTQNPTVYGRIPPQSTPATGVYCDTIVVTVGY